MQTTAFPSDLVHVPAHARVTETYGFTPGVLALGAVLVLVGGALDVVLRGYHDLQQLYAPLGALVAIPLFGGWEVMRRFRRTSLAFAGGHLGVYRSARLAQTASRAQLWIYKLSIANTIREICSTCMLGLMCLGGAVAMIASAPGVGLMCLGGAVGMLGAFASAIWARIACRHFLVPRDGRTERVMLTRTDATRVGL